jgi:two-component system chemotaxis response regulator CheB
MKGFLHTPQAVVVGASTGGLSALQKILGALPGNFPGTFLIVQHRKATAEDLLSSLLRRVCLLPVLTARDKTPIYPGHIYLAPANYHLLVEREWRLSLSIDARVSFARPSIDVLFETAAEVFGKCLIAVLLTGANHDGTAGMRKVNACGGLTIAQDPATAEASIMPQSAIDAGVVDHVLLLEEIADFIQSRFMQASGCE